MKKSILSILMIAISLIGFSQNELLKPKMVKVDGGDFYMGSDYSGAIDEKPEHKVSLDPFYIGVYEVTFDQFDLFCEATGRQKPDDGGFGRGKLPVMNISWEDAVLYCNWLSSRNGYDKVYDISVDSMGVTIKGVNWDANGFRLLTEAEWEFAARGGTKGIGYIYPGSNDPKQVAWFAENSGGKPHPVGTLKPNELGIYDMAGNAYEWVWDYYDPRYYSHSPEANPRGPETGRERVYRGGNFTSDRDFLRMTRRFRLSERINTGMIGMRLARKAD